MQFKKLILCTCGSGKPYDLCCSPKVRHFAYSFANSNEREEFIKKFHISRAFNLRHRGLFAFYGNDFIQYKLEKPKCVKRNRFLTIFSEYLTNYLEDACPESWKKIDMTFWEEFVIGFYPSKIQLTKEENEVELFLSELKTFVKWLDQKEQANWLPLINGLLANYQDELYDCEHLINVLFLQKYPKLHQDGWDYKNDLIQHIKINKQVEVDHFSIFKVTKMDGPITVLEQIDTHEYYHVIGLPKESIKLNILISGGIGKLKQDWLWTWLYPDGAYPNGASKYLENIMLL